MSFSRPSPDIIDEILCRFIINLPEKELKPDRIFFHMQEAYWFYEDFVFQGRDYHPKPPPLTEKTFGQILFERCPLRIFEIRDFTRFYKDFHHYQSQIPVYGAILLNKTLDKVLLVMNIKRTNYSFPKGKINQNESELDCAAREVWEEIGYPITNLISEKHYIQMLLHGHQTNKMYILAGVEENAEFKTKTRGEIGPICWVKLEIIEKSEETYRNSKNPFRNVLPFIKELKTWLRAYKTKGRGSVPNIQIQPEIIDSPMKVNDFEKSLITYSEKKPLNPLDQDSNIFKSFLSKPLIPRFSIPDTLLSDKNPQKTPKATELKKTPTPKKQRKLMILQNKEKKSESSSVLAFERTLIEIANRTIGAFGAQNLKTVVEKNPFQEFRLERLDMASIFTSG